MVSVQIGSVSRRSSFLILAALLLVALLSGCSSPAEKFEKQYNLGVEYLDNGAFEKAIESFSKAIEIDENQSRAYIGRAESYALAGNLENAIADYQRAISLWSVPIEVYLNLADLYIQEGDYQHAIDTFTSVIQLDASSSPVYEMRGDAYLAQGNYTEAVFDYDQSISLGWDCKEKLHNILETASLEIARDEGIEDAIIWLNNVGHPNAAPSAIATPYDLLERLRFLCDSDNYSYSDAVSYLRNSSYRNIVDEALNAGFKMRLDASNGKIIAFYPFEQTTRHFEDSGYMVYFGCLQDEKRTDDDAVWFGWSSDESTAGYWAIGSWENDKPNGVFTAYWDDELYDYYDQKTLTGVVTDGLWVGDIDITIDRFPLVDVTYRATLENGIYQILGTDDGSFIIGKCTDPEYVLRNLVISPETADWTAGIPGYAYTVW